MKHWLRAHAPSRRRLIQLYAALLYNAHLKGFVDGEIYQGLSKGLCVPGLNCYSCPGAVGACPLGALQNALASSTARAPHYVLGIFLIFGLILGRTICGFLCPVGMIQELLYKIPTPKLKKNRFTRALSYLKYVVLAVFVAAIPLAYAAQQYPVPAFCKYICPAGTLEGAVGLLSNPVNEASFSMLNILFTRKFVILVLLGAACVFVFRSFCRFLCPLGAIYGLFSRVSIVGVRVNPQKCVDCGRCIAHCKMDVRRVGDHECIQCGECAGVCPTGAIHWQPKVKKMPKKAVTAAMLAVLAAALVFFNLPSAQETPLPTPEIAPSADENLPEIGSAVGMRCPEWTVPLYGGGEFSVQSARGKPVILNFWATWCTPCVNELPYFQQIYENYGDRAAVVAVHSNLVTDDVPAYLDGKDYTLPFALDEDGSVIASLGGSTMLPMTVILDADGVIAYNQVGSMTYEALEAQLLPLLEAQ